MYKETPFSPRPFGTITEKTHEEHEKLYAGYVKNANSVLEKIAVYRGDDPSTGSGQDKSYELGELYRHFAFEFNGMRNHECYFTLLEGAATTLSAESTLAKQIEKQWGSFENYFAAHLALALTRGIGWAMLSCDACDGSLLLHWVDEQHLGQLQGTTPIIALDMWEHSYVANYQPSGKKQYVSDFMSNVNWSVAQKRYEALAKM